MARRLGLDEAVDLFLDHVKVERGLARHTLDAYGRDLARFTAFLAARGRADVDDIAPLDVMRLHVLREQGWFGRIIALGSVPSALRLSLAIEYVLAAPLARGALRDVITNLSFSTETTKLPVL